MGQIPSDFVAKMSHDLKTPVGNAMMYAELLQEDIRSLAEDHPEIRDRLEPLQLYCGNIHLASSKLINAIQSWGYAYQIENKEFEIQESPIDLTELLDHVITRNKLFIEGKSLDVHIDYRSDRKVIHSDRELMTLVFDNLMSLFVNMAPANSSITIEVDKEDEELLFRFLLPKPVFNQKLIDIFVGDISIRDREAPEQGILKPGGYGLIFVSMALRHVGAVRGVSDEGEDPRSFWFRLPLS